MECETYIKSNSNSVTISVFNYLHVRVTFTKENGFTKIAIWKNLFEYQAFIRSVCPNILIALQIL